MKKNLLVTLVDDKYLDKAKQLFSSVYFNSGWEGDYMLLAYETSDKDLKWFKKKGILIKHASFPRNPNSSYSKDEKKIMIQESRFHIFTEYFKKWDKIIYLDCDILCKGSLDYLLKIKKFGASKDSVSFSKQFKTNKNNKHLFAKIKNKYNLGLDCFCSGVMVINSDIIKPTTFDNLLALAKEYQPVAKHDQAILNLYFYKNWETIPIVFNLGPYNVKPFLFANLSNLNLPAVIFHFFGKRKPWDKDSIFYNEWEKNLLRANDIDLNKTIPAKKLSNEEIKRHSKYLEKKLRINFPLFFLNNLLGKIGLLAKFFLKK